MLKPYATLLRTPGALKFSVAGLIGRMPIAMDSLAIIFIVVAATDSYALAGALTAVGSIVVGAAEVFWSRQADRRGRLPASAGDPGDRGQWQQRRRRRSAPRSVAGR
mgnify:CR=1 FL=1